MRIHLRPLFSSALLERVAIALSIAALVGGSALAAGEPRQDTLRIGYQKSASLLTLQKAQGTLEKRLAPLNVEVRWVEFPAGPQLLEGLNVGSIDVGHVGEAPPIFAQAAGANFVYIGNDPAAPEAEAIVVPEDSPLKTVADLKGKKVALNKGSNVHYLLVRALEKAGLKYSDIQPVFLAPADGRAAFEKGAIDAWVVWDPFLSAAQRQSNVRILADGTGIASYQRYYLAATKFAQARPDVLRVIYNELEQAGKWVKQNPKDAAALLAPVWGIDTATVEQANSRRSYAVRPAVAGGLSEQQKIADAFFAEKLLPKKINALDVALFKPAA